MVLRFVQALLYRLFSFVLSFVLLLPSFSFALGGAVGEEEKGVPRFDSQWVGDGLG